MPFDSPSLHHRSQQGAALLLAIFIIGLAATAYVMHAFNADLMRVQRQEKTAKVLSEAKEALIAWSVSHPVLPGLMPYPDRSGDGNYDGYSDCYATNVSFASHFVVGRLPLFMSDPNCLQPGKGLTVLNGVGGNWRDGAGERLWYQVSKNLLHDYHTPGTLPSITPELLNTSTVPWLVVRDSNGNILSDRVAAVIIAPGEPVGDQDRSGAAPAAREYLDRVVMGDGKVYKNYGYQDTATNPVQEFIAGAHEDTVRGNDIRYRDQTFDPYHFNDRLIYITIDELVAEIQKRVAGEVRKSLHIFYAQKGYFPYAGSLGKNTVPPFDSFNRCILGNTAGTVPIKDPNQSSACVYVSISQSSGPKNNQAKCSFSAVNEIAFTRASGTYGGTSGACVLQNNNKTCACHGAGSCNTSGGTVRFQCDAWGECATKASSGTVGEGNFSFKTAGEFVQNGSTQLTLPANSTGPFSLKACDADDKLDLPNWITDNDWQDSLYYQMARPTVADMFGAGTKRGGAVIIGIGRTITTAPFAAKGAAQIRPSPLVNDYLDSLENTNADNNFDATNKPLSSNYNDQIFLISP